MPRHGALRASRPLLHLLSRAAARVGPASLRRAAPPVAALLRPGPAARRALAASAARPRGIMPHSENPSKAEAAKTEPSYGVLELSDNEYHELADAFLDAVLAKFEHLQDSREDIDVEYSAGVMTITIADKGTYVINKQPPNRQIWLSSPVSGPKRYDWCIVGEGQGEKEGTGSGRWIYTRDGVSLNELIFKELEVEIDGPAGTSTT